MRSKIEEYNGQYVRLQFFPDSEDERKILLATRSGRASDSAEMAVMEWVNAALVRQGLGAHEVLGFEDVWNNVYYIFKVQRSPRGIG